MRGIAFVLGHVPSCTAAVVHDLKDRVSYIDNDLDSGITGRAGGGRCETWSRQVMRSESRPLRARCRDGWSSAPPMCRTALRPACKMLGLSLGISMTIPTMVPLVWQETADLRNAQGIWVERMTIRRDNEL